MSPTVEIVAIFSVFFFIKNNFSGRLRQRIYSYQEVQLCPKPEMPRWWRHTVAEDKRFPIPAAVATPPKQSGEWQSKCSSTYGQICAAVNCNNYTGTCEGFSFFTVPKDEERYAHLIIEFDRYATPPTSSI